MSPTQYDEWVIGLTSGVVASLVATVITWIVVVFWKESIRPRLAELYYQGIDIEGSWTNHFTDDNGDIVSGSMKITQHGIYLTGTMGLRIRRGEYEKVSDYMLSGEIVNGFIRIHTRPKSKRNQTFASGIFLMESDERMAGKSIYIMDDNHAIQFHKDILWLRDETHFPASKELK